MIPPLAARIAQRRFFAVPGVHDPLSALLAHRVGFDVLFASGYWISATGYGLPDAGLLTLTQMRDRLAPIIAATPAAVIADADTGFGGLLNVDHCVRMYEHTGCSAIQIEDQIFPKKCGHSPGKQLVDAAAMVARLRVARAAREKLLIVARTDARQAEGLDGVLRRLDDYARAGADILFPEALADADEIAAVCSRFDLPVMANMANGGLTPMLSTIVLEQTGLAFAIYPSLGPLAAMAAMEAAFQWLKTTGSGEPDTVPLFGFARVGELLGMDAVYAFDRRWAEVDRNLP